MFVTGSIGYLDDVTHAQERVRSHARHRRDVAARAGLLRVL